MRAEVLILRQRISGVLLILYLCALSTSPVFSVGGLCRAVLVLRFNVGIVACLSGLKKGNFEYICMAGCRQDARVFMCGDYGGR